MKTKKGLLVTAAVIAALGSVAQSASADPIPVGWTCNGTCGSIGADGVVTAAPSGSATYQYVVSSSDEANIGVGSIPGIGSGTFGTGSLLTTSAFTAAAGDSLKFNFNFVTSDGSTSFPDYAWAALFDSSNNQVASLFTARTEVSGTIAPGAGLPANQATLNPVSVPIIAGGPVWSPLGTDSGQCFDAGCGYTGWIQSNYTIAAAGTYHLEFGATNWADNAFQTGLAIDGVTVNNVPIVDQPPPDTSVPEPATLGLLGFGLAAIGAKRRRKAN